MKFAVIFIAIMLFIPIELLLLYAAKYPRESALLGKRWQYKNMD